MRKQNFDINEVKKSSISLRYFRACIIQCTYFCDTRVKFGKHADTFYQIFNESTVLWRAIMQPVFDGIPGIKKATFMDEWRAAGRTLTQKPEINTLTTRWGKSPTNLRLNVKLLQDKNIHNLMPYWKIWPIICAANAQYFVLLFLMLIMLFVLSKCEQD